jgi:hypothetical protein
MSGKASDWKSPALPLLQASRALYYLGHVSGTAPSNDRVFDTLPSIHIRLCVPCATSDPSQS